MGFTFSFSRPMLSLSTSWIRYTRFHWLMVMKSGISILYLKALSEQKDSSSVVE